MKLSNIAQNLSNSVIREMFNMALTMKDTISFTVGEPDFPTPQPIIDEACRCWQEKMTFYTPNSGIQPLRNAISEYHQNNWAPDPDTEVLITCGATEAVQLALFTLINPGDEVILVTPAWPNYFGQIGLAGGIAKPVAAREENGFVPDPNDIRNAITDKTKAIILNSPSNPTGAVIDQKTWEELADLIYERDLWVISDEIYNRITYTSEPYVSVMSFDAIRDRTVYVSGFSKMFAMTGWRVGYALSRPEIIRNMTKLHENTTSCIPAPSQMAAALGLRQCMLDVEKMRQSYQARRDLICSLVNQLPGMSIQTPKGAFYAFVNIRKLTEATGMTSREFCLDLLKQTGVVTVPGSGFGTCGEGYLRMSYATSEENIKRGLDRIGCYIQSLGLAGI